MNQSIFSLLPLAAIFCTRLGFARYIFFVFVEPLAFVVQCILNSSDLARWLCSASHRSPLLQSLGQTELNRLSNKA